MRSKREEAGLIVLGACHRFRAGEISAERFWAALWAMDAHMPVQWRAWMRWYWLQERFWATAQRVFA